MAVNEKDFMKPQPKAELVVRRDHSLNGFKIFTASEDAAEWVKREMPAYGQLCIIYPNQFFILVAPTFDKEEVVRYAESYNQVTPTLTDIS